MDEHYCHLLRNAIPPVVRRAEHEAVENVKILRVVLGFRYRTILGGATLPLILSISCGLDREDAARLVQESAAFKSPKAVVFRYGGQNGPNGDSNQIDCFAYPVEARLQELKLLHTEGSFIMRTDEFAFHPDHWPDIAFPATMADEAEALAILGRRDFVKVTGISRESAVSQIEFEWKWKATTLGQNFLAVAQYSTPKDDIIKRELQRVNALVDTDEVHTSILRFRKFDTGWHEEEGQTL